MNTIKQPVIVIFGGDSSFNYLMERYAARSRVLLTVVTPATSAETICRLEPEAIIFQSIENLENSQPLVAKLTNCDIPIIVCSSIIDQIRTRKLGADYCLLHPLVYDSFSSVVESIASQKLNHKSVS